MMQNGAALRAISPVSLVDVAVGPKAQIRGLADDLLGRWLELSELERRAFVAMARELSASSSVIETSAIDLSQRFQNLAEGAKAQMTRVETITDVAQSIDVGGTKVPLTDATRFIENVLIRVIDTVLTISKNAMRMVYSLDDVEKEVQGARKSIAQLHALNQQTRFLALNAAIEAARGGSNSGPFMVIAREIRELSKETDQTAKNISARVASVTDSLRRSHDLLRELATVDMSEHIVAKERLDALLAGMIAQNDTFTAILNETANASAELSETVAPLIMGLQFQDRTAQQLAHVIEALGTLGQAKEALQDETHAAMPGVFKVGEIDRTWLDRMVEKQTLGAVRKRFLTQLVNDGPLAEEECAVPDGDIDLF